MNDGVVQSKPPSRFSNTTKWIYIIMWVQSIKLENIKCFRSQEIAFVSNPKEGKAARKKPYRWITLLGENGVGKSTVLQSLGLLLAGPEAAKELMPRPTGWVQDATKAGEMTAKIHKEESDGGNFGQKRESKIFSYSYIVTGSGAIAVGTKDNRQVYTEPVLLEKPNKILSWLRVNAFASDSKGWFAVGYGAFRRLTRVSQVIIPSLEAPKRSSNFFTQFNEDTSLSSFERWMVYLDFRLAKNPQDLEAQRMKVVGEDAITKLLPGNVKIAEVTVDGLIQFQIGDKIVPSISLSDGFRSVIALAGDLIWRLLQSFPHLENPTQASGVVLIDELDIHLHPSWQRMIAGWLQDVFPNLQFIVATHSPLIASGAGERALTLRFRWQGTDVVVEPVRPLEILADVNRTLTSSAFDLPSVYSPETERKIQTYHQLQRKIHTLEPDERQEYEQLQLFMKEVKPMGNLPEPDSLEARINAFLEANL